MSNRTDAPAAVSIDEWERKFHDDLAADMAFESALLFKELWIVTITVALVFLWVVYL